MISCSALNRDKLITVGGTAYSEDSRKWEIVSVKGGYVILQELYNLDRKVKTKKVSTRTLIAKYLLD